MQILTFIFNFSLLWLFARRYDDWKVGAFAAILAIVAVFGTILVILIFAVFAYKRNQKRIKSFQAFAAQDGWSFVPNETIFYFKDSSRHLLFRYGDSAKRISPLIQKPYEDGQVFVFDYYYTVGIGKNSKSRKMTVIAFHSPRLQLPYFALYPESYWSFLGGLIGWNDIDFTSHPNFSKRYKLSSEEETQVRRVFQPQVLTSFENLPDASVEGGGNYIFLYTAKLMLPIETLNTHLDDAKKIYNLFHR